MDDGRVGLHHCRGRHGRHAVRLEHRLDSDGRLVASSFPRWGDPDRTGTWAEHRFGVEIAGYRQFGAMSIPAEGDAGWHFGTGRWRDGLFFRFEITSHRPVDGGLEHSSSGS